MSLNFFLACLAWLLLGIAFSFVGQRVFQRNSSPLPSNQSGNQNAVFQTRALCFAWLLGIVFTLAGQHVFRRVSSHQPSNETDNHYAVFETGAICFAGLLGIVFYFVGQRVSPCVFWSPAFTETDNRKDVFTTRTISENETIFQVIRRKPLSFSFLQACLRREKKGNEKCDVFWGVFHVEHAMAYLIRFPSAIDEAAPVNCASIKLMTITKKNLRKLIELYGHIPLTILLWWGPCTPLNKRKGEQLEITFENLILIMFGGGLKHDAIKKDPLSSSGMRLTKLQRWSRTDMDNTFVEQVHKLNVAAGFVADQELAFLQGYFDDHKALFKSDFEPMKKQHPEVAIWNGGGIVQVQKRNVINQH